MRVKTIEVSQNMLTNLLKKLNKFVTSFSKASDYIKPCEFHKQKPCVIEIF